MILDEATSSIDTRTERIVQDGMDKLMNGRTTFVIAHRLSTVRNSEASLAAATTSSSVASSLPKRIFSITVPVNKWVWKHTHQADGSVDYVEVKGDVVFNGVDFG